MKESQSFVIDLVENRRDLGNAIALNSFMFNSARLVGPSIAGLLIAYVGEGICFLVNGISFFAIILALLAMRTDQKVREQSSGAILHELREGIRLQNVFGFMIDRHRCNIPWLVILLQAKP
ncbi:MAG: MFS transporter [Smithellaceae bacterium]